MINYRNFSSLKQHIRYFNSVGQKFRYSMAGSSAQSLTWQKSRSQQGHAPFCRLQGRIHVQVHSGGWQDSGVCSCGAEVLCPCRLSSGNHFQLLESLSGPLCLIIRNRVTYPRSPHFFHLFLLQLSDVPICLFCF